MTANPTAWPVYRDQNRIEAIGYHWNPSALAYEVNTGGTATGADVNVTNFPAVISGSSVPVVISGTRTIKNKVVNISATGPVIDAVNGKRIKVFSILIIVSAPITINFRDGASTALEGAQPYTANAGYTRDISPINGDFIIATSAGNSLDIVISGVGTVTGGISYWDDDSI